ncbi:MAG: alpha/beta fold hydrolase [Gemmatimonadaceae bacterium]
MRVQFSGLDTRKRGSPVVVFEAGATNSLEVWRSVLPQVATLAPVVAYDRPGLGRSEWDNETPTPRHVSNRLRRLLQQIGAEPPYVLVGYSWGGTLARYFAGYHPGEVAGLVYVDPGPIVTQSLADNLAPFDAIGAGRAGYDALWSSYAALFERSSPAVRAEFNVFRGLMERDLADRDLWPVPDVPVVVLVAAKPYPPFLKLPYDPQAHFQADLRHRIRMLQEWALAAPRGTLIVSNHTSHAVPWEDPELIVWAVNRVLSAVPNRP